MIVNRSFVADAMLGTLAKWLRILGYDTLFDPALDDHQLVRLSRAENRVLLTRDQQLAQRPGLCVLMINCEELEDQLFQVLEAFDLGSERAYSRCPICNELLETMDRSAAQARVPAYVAQTHDAFRFCPACERVYWRGSHWQRMEKRIARLGDQHKGQESTALHEESYT